MNRGSRCRSGLPMAMGTALLGAALGLAGCGPPAAERHPMTASHRFIAEDPPLLFDRNRMATTEELFHWQLPVPGLDLVMPETPVEVVLEPHLGRLRSLEALPGKPVLEVETHLSTEELSRVEVTLDLDVAALGRFPIGAGVTLFWGEGRSDFGGGRHLLVSDGELRAPQRRVFRLDLGDHPRWSGEEVGFLRFVFTPSPWGRGTMRLVSIRGLGESLDTGGVAALVVTGAKIEAAGETRNALPALPGHPAQLEIERVPRGAELRFAVAATDAFRGGVELQVVAERGRRREVLFRHRVEGAQDWRRHTLPLGAFSRRGLVLRLEAQASTELDPLQGFALWGNPEVVAPRGPARR